MKRSIELTRHQFLSHVLKFLSSFFDGMIHTASFAVGLSVCDFLSNNLIAKGGFFINRLKEAAFGKVAKRGVLAGTTRSARLIISLLGADAPALRAGI